MGLDTYIRRECLPQQRLGDTFLPRMKARRLSSVFAGATIAAGDGPLTGARLVAAPGGLRVITTGPGGTATTTLSEPAARADADQLAELAPACAGCPSSVTGEPFGCYGFVSYPIEAASEQWLFERVRTAGADAAIVASLVPELGCGPHVAGMRARAGMFFESPQPLGLVFELTDGAQLTLTSDAVFELFMFLVPGQLTLAPLLFGVLGLLLPGDRLAERPGAVARPELELLVPRTPQQFALAALVHAIARAVQDDLTIVADG